MIGDFRVWSFLVNLGIYIQWRRRRGRKGARELTDESCERLSGECSIKGVMIPTCELESECVLLDSVELDLDKSLIVADHVEPG